MRAEYLALQVNILNRHKRMHQSQQPLMRSCSCVDNGLKGASFSTCTDQSLSVAALLYAARYHWEQLCPGRSCECCNEMGLFNAAAWVFCWIHSRSKGAVDFAAQLTLLEAAHRLQCCSTETWSSFNLNLAAILCACSSAGPDLQPA